MLIIVLWLVSDGELISVMKVCKVMVEGDKEIFKKFLLVISY